MKYNPAHVRSFAPRRRSRARALKESSIKGKKKNRGTRIPLRRGNHVSHRRSPTAERGKSFMKSSSRKERDTSIPTRHTSAATVLF